jgi:hypothetical protein
MPNLPVPYRLEALARSYETRGLVKQAKALQRRALEVQAEDAARRYVASSRMHGIKRLTKDALEAGGEIADVFAEEVQARPFLARELGGIASTGARGLKTELAYYIEESH